MDVHPADHRCAVGAGAGLLMHNPYAGAFTVTSTWEDHVNVGRPGGVDYGMDEGTPIIAPCDGILHFFLNGDAGFDAVVFRPDNSAERACHNIDNSLARSLHLQQVTEGQHISFSGNTGDSTGPHVHCNGWSPTGERLRPFGGIMTAAFAFATLIEEEDEDMPIWRKHDSHDIWYLISPGVPTVRIRSAAEAKAIADAMHPGKLTQRASSKSLTALIAACESTAPANIELSVEANNSRVEDAIADDLLSVPETPLDER